MKYLYYSDYMSGDRRPSDRRRRRRRPRGSGRGNGSAASGTETDSSVSGYQRGYRSAPPRSTSQNMTPAMQPSAKPENQRQSPGPSTIPPMSSRPPSSQNRNDTNKSSSASAPAPKEQRERPSNRSSTKSSQNVVRNGQSGSESDSKGKKPQNSSLSKNEQLVNGE